MLTTTATSIKFSVQQMVLLMVYSVSLKAAGIFSHWWHRDANKKGHKNKLGLHNLILQFHHAYAFLASIHAETCYFTFWPTVAVAYSGYHHGLRWITPLTSLSGLNRKADRVCAPAPCKGAAQMGLLQGALHPHGNWGRPGCPGLGWNGAPSPGLGPCRSQLGLLRATRASHHPQQLFPNYELSLPGKGESQMKSQS